MIDTCHYFLSWFSRGCIQCNPIWLAACRAGNLSWQRWKWTALEIFFAGPNANGLGYYNLMSMLTAQKLNPPVSGFRDMAGDRHTDTQTLTQADRLLGVVCVDRHWDRHSQRQTDYVKKKPHLVKVFMTEFENNKEAVAVFCCIVQLTNETSEFQWSMPIYEHQNTAWLHNHINIVCECSSCTSCSCTCLSYWVRFCTLGKKKMWRWIIRCWGSIWCERVKWKDKYGSVPTTNTRPTPDNDKCPLCQQSPKNPLGGLYHFSPRHLTSHFTQWQ